ncbi:LOW QUALITY PROTEIN: predicted membrane protein [Vibrio sp. JCM 18904]|nr:LOW QUALITY PROTEIN: predicted membrane protein [Vibrio sp. JCM 18904]
MSTKELLFSFQGRINRKTYWIWNVIYYVSILALVPVLASCFLTLSYVLLPIFLVVLLIPDLAITTKRWHDRNKSIYWLALNIPLIIGRIATPMTSPAAQEPSTPPQMFVASISLICGLWILIECGLLKGTSGPNQYGPEPE